MRTSLGLGTEPGAVEALPAQAIDDETLPARLVGFAEKDGVAIVPFRGKALRVDNQDFFAGPRRGNQRSRVAQSIRRQKRLAGSPKSGALSKSVSSIFSTTQTTVARRLSPVIEMPVAEHCQQFDGGSPGFGIVGALDHQAAETHQIARETRTADPAHR